MRRNTDPLVDLGENVEGGVEGFLDFLGASSDWAKYWSWRNRNIFESFWWIFFVHIGDMGCDGNDISIYLIAQKGSWCDRNVSLLVTPCLVDDSFRCPYSDAKCGRHLRCEICLQAEQTSLPCQRKGQSEGDGTSRQISDSKGNWRRSNWSKFTIEKHYASHTESTTEVGM